MSHNHPVVVKPLNKPAEKFCYSTQFQSHKKVFDSHSQHILLLCLSSSFYCFVREEERGRRCSFKRIIFYFYFPACCLCQLCDRCIKKNLWTCCKCKASNNALLSSKLLVIECYPAAPKYEEMIIIPPSVFNYGEGGH